MTNAGVRGLLFFVIGLMAILGFMIQGPAFAQSGSGGGSIGNDEKSLSGSQPDKPAEHEAAPKPRLRETPHERPARAIPHVVAPAPAPTTSLPTVGRGAGHISDGNCVCKNRCILAGQTGQCIATCERTYPGCNRGMIR